MPILDTTAQLAGRYRLLEKLGEGGMGAVYKAHDAKLDRTVAVKVMAARLVSHPDSLARFQREAKALAKVAHPGIVQAFDTDCDGDQHYLVMEFVEGHSLFHVVRSQDRIAPTHAADYGYQAALALHHAHERGLIHRDVKPHNLLLTPAGQVKVLDLGLARFAQDHVGDSGLTREGVGMGSPDYMAPEQFAHANRADERSDIYSLGCTLFHLVCGRVVFPGTSLAAKSHAHDEQESPRVEDLCPEAPVGLALAVRKMLAKEPDERFQSMQEVAEALAPYVAGSSISLPVIEKTSNWEGSQLSFHAISLRSTKGGNGATPTTPTVHRARQRRLNWLVGGIAAAAVLVVALLLIRRPAGEPDSGAPPTSPSTGESASVAPGSAPVVRTPFVPTVPAASSVRTVSKDAEGGGQFRTIGEALENATPRMTIRVLDDAVYTESLLLNEPEHHTGLKLEAANGATIRMPPGEYHAIRIAGVADVEIRGFRFATGTGTPSPKESRIPTFVFVESKSPGVVLEHLRMKSSKPVCGVLLLNLGLLDADEPIVVRHCFIEVGYYAIMVSGQAGATASSNVCINDNRIAGAAKGISIEWNCRRIHVVGNVISNANMAGIELRSLQPTATDILVANNSIRGGRSGIRVWSDPPYSALTKNQVAIRNNVVMCCGVGDFIYVRYDPDMVSSADSTFLLDLWRFDHNWRDQVGAARLQLIPLAPDDHTLDMDEFVSLDAADPNFLRPRKDSPLAAEGAGRTDPRLPNYVGAVPPEGVPAWDWERTYRAYTSGEPAPKDAEMKP